MGHTNLKNPSHGAASGSEDELPIQPPWQTGEYLDDIRDLPTSSAGSSEVEGGRDYVQTRAMSIQGADLGPHDEVGSFDYRGKLAPLGNQDLRSMVFHDVKVTHHVSRVAMKAFRSLHTEDRPSDSRTTKKRMTVVTGVEEVRYDCCIEGCISYALPKYASLDQCPIKGCMHQRFKANGKPYAQHTYIPIIHRLRLMYSDKGRAIEMMTYRAKMDREMASDVC